MALTPLRSKAPDTKHNVRLKGGGRALEGNPLFWRAQARATSGWSRAPPRRPLNYTPGTRHLSASCGLEVEPREGTTFGVG